MSGDETVRASDQAPDENRRKGTRKTSPGAEQQQAPATAETKNENQAPPITPATAWQKVLLVIFLFVTTGALLWAGEWTLRHYDQLLTREVAVRWKAHGGAVLKAGPACFSHDEDKGALIYKGPIDDAMKKELLALIVMDNVPKELRDEEIKTYREAIQTLACLSNAEAYRILLFLLLLSGIGGTIGVQIRSVSNFIGVACFKNELDLKRWWPWYILRPLLGFLFGILIVILIKANLFMGTETPAEQGNLWWLGIAVLVGFGASDFSERLRLLTQTLFGKNFDKSGKRSTDESTTV